ncbi:carbonic anhydrase 2-like [Parasteatoda tepidariorum]|uniref:carbonic anhydrase 2-like n=1 Tax=Parasteatoda tepidariorum TaxID=114398 RepID=UPI00077FE0CD|nr:carbonic anhydrase 2-like [Parasteatoda tepidariorum]
MQLMTLITIVWGIISCLHISRISAQECPADRYKQWAYNPYYPNGPLNWKDTYYNCKGKSQSPINIITSIVNRGKGRQYLKLRGYEIPLTNVKIENKGYTIEITPRDGIKRSIDLDNVRYNLKSFHFHWGNLQTEGSEHKINGRQYAMEVHFVHKNDQGKLAVVGVLFQESNVKNLALDVILSARDEYLYKDETFEGTIRQKGKMAKIYLEDLVDNGCSLYRYSGSLTTPPCTENVTWLVCKAIKYVKRSQMRKLFLLYSVRRGTGNKETCILINNHRNIQPLNGRIIYS